MWFGTDNGLARFDGRRIQNFSLGEADTNRVLALKTSGTGELWVGTRAGAFVYSGNRFRPVGGTEKLGVTAIVLGREVFLGTDTGLVLRVTTNANGELSAAAMFEKPLRSDDGSALSITSLMEHDGKLLVSTLGRGVFIVREDQISEFPSAPRPLFVNSLEQSDTGKLWLGSDAAKGLSGIYFAEEGDSRRAIRIPAPTANVLSLEANDSGLWAGTELFGVFHLAGQKVKKNYTFENTSGGLRSNNIFIVFTDREGVVWIGTNRGVSRFDRLGALQEMVSGIPNSNFIRSLFRSSDGRIYAGSNRGLFVKDGDKWDQVAAYGNQPVYAISEDRSKKLLVGTEDVGRRSFAADGALWTAGDHGVFRMQNGQPEKIIEAEDVRDVFVEGGDVWAATTTRGLLHARNDPQFGWLVSSVGFEQGLPSEKAFAILPLSDGLLIATNRGVVTYKPGAVAPKLIPTRVLSQRAHDLSEINSTIALDYPQNSLLIEVAGQSSRTFPEEFQYGFVLTNSKGETIDRRLSNDSQYAPADLAPGDYTIESIAFNRDLLASEPLMIRFAVAKAPFPWTATALGALLFISLVGLIWAVIEHRRIAQRNRELAAARFDLANEAERERRRIARDLHDQTLADLRNLMITSDKLVADNSEFRSEIEAVSTEIRRICEDLSPSVLENVGLVAALEFLLDRTVANRSFHADAAVEERINFPLNVQLQIYRIAQEVLTNIDRHSNAELVEMTVEASALGEFDLTIRDNGHFFQPDATAKKGRGISNIRSRANLINGKVTWKESRRGGNVFSLRIDPSDGSR